MPLPRSAILAQFERLLCARGGVAYRMRFVAAAECVSFSDARNRQVTRTRQ